MQTVQAVVMGFMQGLTEFLPVSSSGHIVLSSAFYKLFTGENYSIVANEEIFFDILIHLSTLFAVLIYFAKDVKKLIFGFFVSLSKKDYQNKDFKFCIYIIAATFITGIFGFLIKGIAHKITENPFIVSIFIFITGLVLFISEKIKPRESEINLKTALIIGLFQGFAVIPGLSRSGMTISSAMFNGIKRFEAAKFSFILSIPVIILASLVYPLISFDLSEVKNFNFSALISGMITSFIIGYFCIKYFMAFVKSHSMKCFSYYCFIAALAGILIFRP